MKRWLGSLVLFLTVGNIQAQTCADYVVQINATVQASPPQIALTWPAVAGSTGCKVYRKQKNDNNWGAVISTLPGTATGYTDNNVSADSTYEYSVQMSGGPAFGYIYAGIKAPAIHNRGTLLLLVDSLFIDTCGAEITQLIKDVSGDGWAVIRKDMARTASDVSIREFIKSTKATIPGLAAVMIVGHLAVPYSGNFDQGAVIAPDGHPDHAGAWPADSYYGELTDTWADAITNVLGSRTANKNNPGDGKWDVTQLQSDLELQVSRIDFSNMPAFTKTENELMKSYLNKDHQYKSGQLIPDKKVLIDDNFGKFSGEGFAAAAYRLAPLTGSSNIQVADFVTSLNTTSYQWAFGCGGGSFTNCSGVGSTTDFTTNNVNAIFTLMFGSYFGDWNVQNNFLRSVLCSNTPALTSCWTGRPHFFYHHMALGEHIGYSTLTSQNNTNSYYNAVNIYPKFVHTALMGDLTLRTDYIKPPSAAILTAVTGGGAQLSWTASPEPGVIGYYVYRSSSALGTYMKRSEIITGTSYMDSFGTDGMSYYMVRAVKLQSTPSGVYHNLSLGSTSAGVNIDFPYADNTTGITQLLTKNTVSVYPNPATDQLNVTVHTKLNGVAYINVLNQQGQKLLTQQTQVQNGDNTIAIKIADLPPGLYYLMVTDANTTSTVKWMKK